jgi:hypothetical protein
MNTCAFKRDRFEASGGRCNLWLGTTLDFLRGDLSQGPRYGGSLPARAGEQFDEPQKSAEGAKLVTGDW